MFILESDALLTIPTNPEELADLLEKYAHDWGTVLQFLSVIAEKQGIYIKDYEVKEIMIRRYTDGN